MTDNYKFDYYNDWSILADYFNISVSTNEVKKAREQLKNKNLYLTFDSDKRIIDLAVSNTHIMPVFEGDIPEKIKLYKLKQKITDLMFESKYSDDEEQTITDLRHFVEEHAKRSVVKSKYFWQKVSEIEDDHVFLQFLAKNIGDLWF